MTEKDALVCL